MLKSGIGFALITGSGLDSCRMHKNMVLIYSIIAPNSPTSELVGLASPSFLLLSMNAGEAAQVSGGGALSGTPWYGKCWSNQ